MKWAYSYLVEIQFLGFRFHGWQKQTNSMSLHEMMDKMLGFVLGKGIFKSLGMGRTDAKVSANRYYFQLFLNETINEELFLKAFNKNASQDLKAVKISIVSTDFNIIQSAKIKEYHYYFSFGTKNHPYSAPFLVGVLDDLDIEATFSAIRRQSTFGWDSSGLRAACLRCCFENVIFEPGG
ncbi:MAG: hypothetical protein GKR88_06705 [Flavobacteriaceae bacterium]|nr:MAG: hypothetical protein GKR88_06705 [Flavobacteriaceae bacterium]